MYIDGVVQEQLVGRGFGDADAAQQSAAEPGHLRRHPALIEKNQIPWRDRAQGLQERLPPLPVGLPVALLRVERLFYAPSPAFAAIARAATGSALLRWPSASGLATPTALCRPADLRPPVVAVALLPSPG